MKKILCLLSVTTVLFITACSQQDSQPEPKIESTQNINENEKPFETKAFDEDTTTTQKPTETQTQKEIESVTDKNEELNNKEESTANTNDNITEELNNKEESTTNTNDNITENPSETLGEVITEQSKSYYGNWNIISCIATAPVSALSKEEIDQLLGTTIIYEKESYTWKENICSNPSYQESFETNEEFAESYRNSLTFSDLGISDSKVLAVVVDNSDFLGEYFYVKDENTLIIFQDGVFLEATRN